MTVNSEVGNWFSCNREKYAWHSSSRNISEERIDRLAKQVEVALGGERIETIQDLLVQIHRWKTNNRGGTTDEYRCSLKTCGAGYIQYFQNLYPFSDTNNLQNVVSQLHIEECNLPTCTAIASFLYGRHTVPVLDRYIAMFFTKRFMVSGVDSATSEVLDWVSRMDFKLDKGGKKLRNGRALRLAVYNPSGFNANLAVYIEELVPECARIANALNQDGYTYTGVDGSKQTFAPVDVEMAIFAWCREHSKLFDVTDRC